MQTECPLLRELPRPHSRSPLKPAQIVNQNHDECRGRSPIKNSPRITATKSPFATSKKKRDKTHDRLKTIPTAVKTTYHYNDVAPSKPPPPPAVFGGENYPFALSQMSPIHGLAESAFERSSAIFRQIINSKTSKVRGYFSSFVLVVKRFTLKLPNLGFATKIRRPNSFNVFLRAAEHCPISRKQSWLR